MLIALQNQLLVSFVYMFIDVLNILYLFIVLENHETVHCSVSSFLQLSLLHISFNGILKSVSKYLKMEQGFITMVLIDILQLVCAYATYVSLVHFP